MIRTLSALLSIAASSLIYSADAPPQTTQMPSQYHGDITPLAGPIVRNWAGLYVSADFIYWQVREDGLQYAHDGIPLGAAPVAKEGEYKTFDFKYEPGFKVGLGVDFRHDGWDLFLNYTWFEDSNTSHISVKPSRGSLDVIDDPGFSSTLFSSGEAHWLFHFNALDLTLGRNFYISQQLALRPFMGVKGAWIDQNFDVDSTPLLGQTATLKQSQDFWGAGLRGGLSTYWHFTRNWSLYGDVAISALYSLFQDKLQGDLSLQNRSFRTINPVLEMEMGLRYETFFSQDRYQLFAQLGWEQQVWFSHNQLLLTDSNTTANHLVLQGLDLRFGFNF